MALVSEDPGLVLLRSFELSQRYLTSNIKPKIYLKISNDNHGITIKRKPKIILANHKKLPAIVPKPAIKPASIPCITNRRNVIK